MPLFSIEQTYTKELYHEYAWCAYDKQKSYKKLVFSITGLVLVIALIGFLYQKYTMAVIVLIAAPIYPFLIKKAKFILPGHLVLFHLLITSST